MPIVLRTPGLAPMSPVIVPVPGRWELPDMLADYGAKAGRGSTQG